MKKEKEKCGHEVFSFHAESTSLGEVPSSREIAPIRLSRGSVRFRDQAEISAFGLARLKRMSPTFNRKSRQPHINLDS